MVSRNIFWSYLHNFFSIATLYGNLKDFGEVFQSLCGKDIEAFWSLLVREGIDFFFVLVGFWASIFKRGWTCAQCMTESDPLRQCNDTPCEGHCLLICWGNVMTSPVKTTTCWLSPAEILNDVNDGTEKVNVIMVSLLVSRSVHNDLSGRANKHVLNGGRVLWMREQALVVVLFQFPVAVCGGWTYIQPTANCRRCMCNYYCNQMQMHAGSTECRSLIATNGKQPGAEEIQCARPIPKECKCAGPEVHTFFGSQLKAFKISFAWDGQVI